MSLDRFSTGFLGRTEVEKARTTRERVKDIPLAVVDNPDLTMWAIRSAVRRWRTKHERGIVLIDYLQLVNAEHAQRSRNRYEIVGEFSRTLKGLAKETRLPVVVLAQLGREAEKRGRRLQDDAPP